MPSYKKKSQTQEKRVAKSLGGKTTIASGALWSQKADVRLPGMLVECKTTEKDYYILTIDTWKKIAKEALKDGMRTPVMQIDLQDGESKLIVLNYHDFLAMELDQFSYLMTDEPILVGGKSFRVHNVEGGIDWSSDAPEELKKTTYYIRQDFKFVDAQLHLVVLKWSDFHFMLKEVNR